MIHYLTALQLRGLSALQCAHTHQQLAKIYTSQHLYDKAIYYYAKCNEYDPENMECISELVNLLVMHKRLAEAESLLLRAIRKKPNNIDLIVKLARVYLGLNRDLEALRLLKKSAFIISKQSK